MKEFFLSVANNIFPEIIIALLVALILWVIKEIRAAIKILKEIPDIKCDIKKNMIITMYQFRRIDAQDEATKELFSAIKNNRVNGEAERAIIAMEMAKRDSDRFLKRVMFDDDYINKEMSEGGKNEH